MFAPDVTNTVLHWPFLFTLVRLSLALGTGAFVGLEREPRGKAGARTFTFASLIGCLGGLLGNSYAVLATTIIGLFVCFLNFREWKLNNVGSANHCRIPRGSSWHRLYLYSCRHRSHNGSVATLQVARDRLAGCFSWRLRFAVYSSGGNLSRRSSCWQWDGTCAFPFRTATVEELLRADHVTVWRWVQRYGVGGRIKTSQWGSNQTQPLISFKPVGDALARG